MFTSFLYAVKKLQAFFKYKPNFPADFIKSEESIKFKDVPKKLRQKNAEKTLRLSGLRYLCSRLPQKDTRQHEKLHLIVWKKPDKYSFVHYNTCCCSFCLPLSAPSH